MTALALAAGLKVGFELTSTSSDPCAGYGYGYGYGYAGYGYGGTGVSRTITYNGTPAGEVVETEGGGEGGYGEGGYGEGGYGGECSPPTTSTSTTTSTTTTTTPERVPGAAEACPRADGKAAPAVCGDGPGKSPNGPPGPSGSTPTTSRGRR